MASEFPSRHDFAWVREQLTPPPFPLVGPTAWSGMRWVSGWGGVGSGSGAELHRVTLGHVDPSGRQLYIETAAGPHHTTSTQLSRHDLTPLATGPPIRIPVGELVVELVRAPVRAWNHEHIRDAVAPPWAAVGHLGDDGPGGVEFSIEACGMEPGDVGLVVDVDLEPYLRATTELEQRHHP